MKLVSIIIPVYNCEKYLQRNLETVTSQTYSNLEIIYVDDGSSDRSAEIIQSFMESDQRIKLIRQTNHGVSYARNAGLKVATGAFITFVDSDDYVDSRYVEVMATDLQKERSDIACCGLVLHRPDQDIPLRDTGELLVWDAVQAQKQLLSGEYLEPSVWGKMFCREIVKGVRFRDGIKYSEDLLWALEAFCNCKKVVFRAEANYHYVLHPNSATTNAPVLKQAKDLKYVAEAALEIPFSEEILVILERRRLLGYLAIYNSLICARGEEIKVYKNEIRKKVLSEKKKYSAIKKSSKECFYYYGIKLCPPVYQCLFRLLKRILPDRRVFKV